MTAFVVHAAGRGTRVGRVGGGLHKALLPLGGQAVLTRLFELAPAGARLVVCVGDRAQQLRDYVELAHPKLDVTFVDVPVWQGPGSGPGRSLLAARDEVGDDDMLFTSCDTLWTRTPPLTHRESWAAYAPMPAGTEPQRWCRFDISGGVVTSVLDKVRNAVYAANVYTGLAYVRRSDVEQFWAGLAEADVRDDAEIQISSGLRALDRLGARRIDWIDTGDEAAYRRAVAQLTGYDWTKTDQATYVLPGSGRVVKYMTDASAIVARNARGFALARAVPRFVAQRDRMLAYEYVAGETVYERLERDDDVGVTRALLAWRREQLMQRVFRDGSAAKRAVDDFYVRKTHARVATLPPHLQRPASDAIGRVDFDALAAGFEPGIPHGDLNYGNIVVTPNDQFVGIDWREDFAGRTWFDLRYDAAKLLAGTEVHWGRARRGDFTPWDAGRRHADVMRAHFDAHGGAHVAVNGGAAYLHDVEVIAALTLLNSAPLHAEPLDEILVARGCAWLERLT